MKVLSIVVHVGGSEAKDLKQLQARQRARQRRECAASLRVVCDIKAKLMQRREGLDARQLAESPWQGSELAATFKLQAAVSPIRSGISCSSSNPRSVSCLSDPSLPSPLGSALSLPHHSIVKLRLG